MMLGRLRCLSSLSLLAAMLTLWPVMGSAAPSAERCRAIGEVLASSYDKWARMASLLLVTGPDNGATEPELAKLRGDKASAEARRDRALAIARRFASAKAASPATMTALNDVKMSELEVELSACGSAPAAPKPAPAASSQPQMRTDYYGNDIRGIDVAGEDWRACQAHCRAEPACIVWTLYTPPPGAVGGCWLKHSKGRMSAQAYSISGTR